MESLGLLVGVVNRCGGFLESFGAGGFFGYLRVGGLGVLGGQSHDGGDGRISATGSNEGVGEGSLEVAGVVLELFGKDFLEPSGGGFVV